MHTSAVIMNTDTADMYTDSYCGSVDMLTTSYQVDCKELKLK
jgi:hypothetical protein